MDYGKTFLDCFLNTKHAGALTGHDVRSFLHRGKQPFSSCQFFIRVTNDVIAKACFQASSTPALIAVSEYVCRWIEGKNLAQLNELQPEKILEDLKLPSTFMHIINLVYQQVLSFKQAEGLFKIIRS